ncbi:DUF6160 family protein [Desulforegula conservatrix]|uniref:DUF6160 family protein n=1 Tax=Desulforegula conservatrix TaxID=153026 RepID=UPI0003F99D9B|nr:DUF6160 family protein [Desulforegula conservatrix]
MKKFLAGIAAAAIITIPMTSFALESMSKGALKKATGQAGVSIALDNVVIVQKSMPTTTYWDVDGTSSAYGTAGQVTSAGLKIAYTAAAEKMIVLDGILDNSKYGAALMAAKFGIGAATATEYGIAAVGIAAAGAVTDPSNGDIPNAGDKVLPTGTNAHGDTIVTAPAGYYLTGISPLSIDVGTCQSLTAGLQYNLNSTALDVAGVVIGLPTIEITTFHSNDTKIISITSGAPAVTANSGGTVANISNEIIRIEKSGTSQMAILGGRLEIAPH